MGVFIEGVGDNMQAATLCQVDGTIDNDKTCNRADVEDPQAGAIGEIGASNAVGPEESYPPPKPRVVLLGAVTGLFVVINPERQRTKVNLKRELESVGVYQRDIDPTEETQLSFEQAFFLMTDLRKLEIYLPPNEKGDQEGPLTSGRAWQTFSQLSTTFRKSAGAYRYFRRKGFVVHGGLNLGMDFMLYRGTPERHHAEFGVYLRYPAEGDENTHAFTLRDLHLLYRLIGEVRKTLILGHVRLGKIDGETSYLQAIEDQEYQISPKKDDTAVAMDMDRWYTGMTVYEVAVTPWRAHTPLARVMKSSCDAGAQLKHKKHRGNRRRRQPQR